MGEVAAVEATAGLHCLCDLTSTWLVCESPVSLCSAEAAGYLVKARDDVVTSWGISDAFSTDGSYAVMVVVVGRDRSAMNDCWTWLVSGADAALSVDSSRRPTLRVGLLAMRDR